MATVNLENGIPLPIGTDLDTDGRRVHGNPLVRQLTDEVEIRSSTDSGWPTIIVGEFEGSSLGVAVDYPGDWHNGPIDEINVGINEDNDWFAMISFRNKDTAIESGNYEIDGYEGYELHEWNPGSHHEVIEECLERNVTPIFYTPDFPYNHYAHAFQKADSYLSLKKMFGLSRYPQIEERQERLYNFVVPQDARWEDEDTSMQDLAKDILNQNSDS